MIKVRYNRQEKHRQLKWLNGSIVRQKEIIPHQTILDLMKNLKKAIKKINTVNLPVFVYN